MSFVDMDKGKKRMSNNVNKTKFIQSQNDLNFVNIISSS